MRYKTAFRLAIKVLGVWFLANGLGQIANVATAVVYAYRADRPWWEQAQIVFSTALYIGIGCYFFIGGRWLVDKAIPSNRPYCHECAYELNGLPVDGVCPECGFLIDEAGSSRRSTRRTTNRKKAKLSIEVREPRVAIPEHALRTFTVGGMR